MLNLLPEEKNNLPRHVALIMDGNGRWAKSRNRPRLFGHRNGVENVRAVVDTAKEVGVPYITLFAFSTENQSRPKEEKSGLMKLLEEFLKKELRSMMKDGIRLRAIGDLSGLPDFARKIVEETIEQTKENETWNLTLALNYGSRQEILKAVAKYAQNHPNPANVPTWEEFFPYLETADLPDPDLIIRTSGEFRLSNFLLLQAAYAEIFVTSLHWPDFDRDAFIEALANYARRERRFGKTSDQIHQPIHCP
ncbi:MAG: polyprenyl diphosphate synthase [Opitutae bacterium]